MVSRDDHKLIEFARLYGKEFDVAAVKASFASNGLKEIWGDDVDFPPKPKKEKHTTPVTDAEKDFHFYQTPLELAKEIARQLIFKPLFEPDYFSELLNGSSVLRILDTGAGKGIFAQAIREVYYELNVKQELGIDILIDGLEIRLEEVNNGHYDNFYYGDYTEIINPITLERYHFVVGNPPFKLSEAFVSKSQFHLLPHGRILFLLPFNFMYTQDRGDNIFSGVYHLKYQWNLLRRPSFKGRYDENGKFYPNSTAKGAEYSIFEFHRDYDGTDILVKAFYWGGKNGK